jgi:hypothetical protein
MTTAARREDYAPASDWLTDENGKALRDWWGRCGRLLRESVDAPAWADYVDRNGGAWTRAGLFGEYVALVTAFHSEAMVSACLFADPARCFAEFESWVAGCVWDGELVRLVDECEA